MSSGKWIPDLTPDTPTVDAGRRALSLRLEALREALGTSLQSIDEDLENVHQLRVACRRATAAVDLFQVCMPPKVARNAKQTLRTFRRGAGEARDWDVLALSLEKRLKESTAEQLPGVDLLFGYCMAQRIPAQDRLEAMCPGYPFEYERWMTRVLSSLRPCESGPHRVMDLGREVLLPQFETFWQYVTRPEMTWPDLHETRIQGKRLRYELELLGAAFPEKTLDVVYRRISDVQTILGDANDGFVGVERMEILQRRLPQLFGHLWPRWSPFIEQLLQEYRQAMNEARDQFEAWRSKAERDQFDGVIRNILGGPATRSSTFHVVEQAS